MWLDRLAGQNASTLGSLPWSRSSSQVPQSRSSLQINRSSVELRRSDQGQRVSSWAALSNGVSYTDTARSSSKSTSLSRADTAADPSKSSLEILTGILGSTDVESTANGAAGEGSTGEPDSKVDGNDSSLEDSNTIELGLQEDAQFNVEAKIAPLEELHKSILACDEILSSIEKNFSTFQSDLLAASAEIESLQNRSNLLQSGLQRRRELYTKLGPEVERLRVVPGLVKKLVDGQLDDNWVKAVRVLDSALIDHELALKNEGRPRAVEDLTLLLFNLRDRVIQRTRDHFVSQIKAIRAPGANAQVLQRNTFLKYKDCYTFLAKHQPQLENELAQAYVNTMRWYYLTNFTRYRTAIGKLQLHSIDKADAFVLDDSQKRSTSTKAPQISVDAFVLGRRIDCLNTPNTQALPSFIAEEDKSFHFMEASFRAFNLALVDNATSEFNFLTELFSQSAFSIIRKRFIIALTPTLDLGYSVTKSLIESSTDALGILICVRLNQHNSFELQRKQVPVMEAYVNQTGMILWPRFQMVMDMHCEACKKAATSFGIKVSNSVANLVTNGNQALSVAPHPITQRFANFVHAVLRLGKDAADDEPVQRSLNRLRQEFQALLMKISKSIPDATKRERFLANNYSLILTILVDSPGKMADEMRQEFAPDRL